MGGPPVIRWVLDWAGYIVGCRAADVHAWKVDSDTDDEAAPAVVEVRRCRRCGEVDTAWVAPRVLHPRVAAGKHRGQRRRR